MAELEACWNKIAGVSYPNQRFPSPGWSEQYCDVPGSPCLSKMGPVVGPSFSIFGSLLRTRGSLARVLLLPGAKVVCWRPHLAGT